MSSIPVFDISNPLGGLVDQAVSECDETVDSADHEPGKKES